MLGFRDRVVFRCLERDIRLYVLREREREILFYEFREIERERDIRG